VRFKAKGHGCKLKAAFVALSLILGFYFSFAQNLNDEPSLNSTNSNTKISSTNELNASNNEILKPRSDFILLNESVLNDKVTQKLSQMGTELYQKTGIFLALAASNQKSLEELQSLRNELKAPYALLVLSVKSHKVDILTSNEVGIFFNKNEVLERSIFPILGNTKASDIYNASMLNGYADIADHIANYFHIKLESSIGNANRDVINILRVLFYGFICFAILFYFMRKSKKRKIKFEEK